MAFLAPLLPTAAAPPRRAPAALPPRVLSMSTSPPPPPPRSSGRRSPGGRGNVPPRRPPPPPARGGAARPAAAAAASDAAAAATWQEQVRLLLSPTMNGSARATLTTSLLRRSPEVLRDVQAAACAALGATPSASSSPSSSARGARSGRGGGFGDASGGKPGGPPAGVERVVRQVTEDVLPDVLRNGPAIARSAVSSVASTLADVAADPAAAVANLAPPSPSPAGAPTGGGGDGGSRAAGGGGGGGGGGGTGPYGLETPEYEVLASRTGYEVRRYASFTTASTVMPDAGGAGDGEVASALASGGGFNTLARYLFGGNAAGQSMAMTTPVITTTTTSTTRTGSGKAPVRREMAFVLPASAGGVDAAPAPRGPGVTVAPAGDAVLAVATFAGWATEGEVRRQKAALLSALAVDGVALARSDEHLVMQYDPPGTPPLSRRNELAVRVMWEAPVVVVV